MPGSFADEYFGVDGSGEASGDFGVDGSREFSGDVVSSRLETAV